MDIEKVAAAIEAEAGESLPDLRQALAEAKVSLGGVAGRASTLPPASPAIRLQEPNSEDAVCGIYSMLACAQACWR